MLERTYYAVKEYLESNTEEALDLACQMDSEDGSFDWTRTYDWDELCEVAAEGGADAVDELVRSVVYGDGSYGTRVRYNAYANIISGEQDDLLRDASDYLIDIVKGLEDYIDDDGYVNSLVVSDALQDIIDESLEVTVQVYNIDYDIDEEDRTAELLESLPKALTLLVRLEDGEINEESLADEISETTGWCINSYRYSIVEEE